MYVKRKEACPGGRHFLHLETRVWEKRPHNRLEIGNRLQGDSARGWGRLRYPLAPAAGLQEAEQSTNCCCAAVFVYAAPFASKLARGCIHEKTD